MLSREDDVSLDRSGTPIKLGQTQVGSLSFKYLYKSSETFKSCTVPSSRTFHYVRITLFPTTEQEMRENVRSIKERE